MSSTVKFNRNILYCKSMCSTNYTANKNEFNRNILYCKSPTQMPVLQGYFNLIETFCIVNIFLNLLFHNYL